MLLFIDLEKTFISVEFAKGEKVKKFIATQISKKLKSREIFELGTICTHWLWLNYYFRLQSS